MPETELENLSRRWRDVPRALFLTSKERLLDLQRAEIERLQAIVDQYLKTGDGVPILPDTDMDAMKHGDTKQGGEKTC